MKEKRENVKKEEDEVKKEVRDRETEKNDARTLTCCAGTRYCDPDLILTWLEW